MKLDISVIYVYYNTPRELLDSVNSLSKAVGKLRYEVIVVDNNSSKKIPRELVTKKRIKILKGENVGYGAGLNVGARLAKGRFLVLCNPDVVFEKSAIEILVRKLKTGKVGLGGPQMCDVNGKVLTTVSDELTVSKLLFASPLLNKFSPSFKDRVKKINRILSGGIDKKVDVIGGACMAIRREVFEESGGFDPRFFMYFEENDFCKKIRDNGYHVMYIPAAKVFHKVGASITDQEFVKKNYQQSRYKYFRKNNNFISSLLAELFLRLQTISGMLLIVAIVSSIFLNLYLINTHTLFIGDFGRDYLAARDMLVSGKIPLVGIPSSVVWLHQGPLSIYFIAISLLIGNFNPVAPAIFYALLGVLTVPLIYFFARQWFGDRAASISALLYATSPLVILSARMPYHTSSIPFFALTFFLLITRIIKGDNKYIFLASLNFGVLLLLELSNAVLLLVVGVLYLIKLPKIGAKTFSVILAGVLLGILPFLLYDITHKFTQTVGFPLWIANRIRLFLGLAPPDKVTSGNLPQAFERMYQQAAGIIFPESQLVVVFVGFLVLYYFFTRRSALKKYRQLNGDHIVLLWLLLPVVGFLVHAAPGTAYFPLLFPAVLIAIGAAFANILKNRSGILIILLLCFLNAYFLIQNEYYLSTPAKYRGLPPFNYTYGMAFLTQIEAAKEIVNNAGNNTFSVAGGGALGRLVTGTDNYQYLLWYFGGRLRPDADLRYVIYEGTNIPAGLKNKIFSNNLITVFRDVKN